MANLVVDLDHTLITTDLLQLSLKQALKQNPLLVCKLPFWFANGNGYVKDELVKYVSIDVTTLPYNTKVISYIRERKKAGDTIILATASHRTYAAEVAKYVKLFDRVFASNRNFNLSSHNKAHFLVEELGFQNFDYIGDHTRDIPVWEAAKLTIIARDCATKGAINGTKHLERIFIG